MIRKKISEVLKGGLFTDGDWINSKDQDPDGEIRLIQLADIGDGVFINKSSRYINNATAKRLKCTFLKKGDVLVARMPDPLGRSCIFPLEGYQKYITAVDVCILRPDEEKVSNSYLSHMINSPFNRSEIERQSTGTTRKRITRKRLGNLEIPFPPLKTQEHIASILDDAAALRDKTAQLLEEYTLLEKSVFQTMFGNPLKNELEFKYPKLKEVCKVSQGMQIAIANRFKEDGPNRYKYITIAFLNGRKTPEFIENPRTSVICDYDDIIMVRTGDPGRVISGVHGVFHNNFFKIDWDKEILNKEYFLAFLSNENVKNELVKRASSTTIPDLNHGDFYGLKVMVPPMKLQNEFAEKIALIEQQKDLARQELKESEDLFNCLLQKAFKGELVPESQEA